jgi:hypothetical protein
MLGLSNLIARRCSSRLSGPLDDEDVYQDLMQLRWFDGLIKASVEWFTLKMLGYDAKLYSWRD